MQAHATTVLSIAVSMPADQLRPHILTCERPSMSSISPHVRGCQGKLRGRIDLLGFRKVGGT